jgi:hypothetical protein
MTTRARGRRDLSWPVPATDLQDLDVIEILQGDDGQVLLRVDEQTGAAPRDSREALLKRRHVDEADAGSEPAPVAGDGSAGLAPPAMADVLDMTAALQLRENLEFVDVPVLHALQAPPEVPFSWRAGSADPATHAQLTEPSAARHAIDAPTVAEPAIVDAWPQVVEFVDTMEFVAPVHEPEVTVVVESSADADMSAMDAPDVPMPQETRPVAATGRVPMLSAAALSAWIAAARERALAHIEPAERLALVGGGMLMGVLFAVVGGSPLPATTTVPGIGRVAAQVSNPGADAAASGTTIAQRLVSASFTEASPVPPFPITIPAVGALAPGAKAGESFPDRGEGAVPISTPRPRPQAAPAVLGAIQRYAVAFNRQDARATTAVWPSADRQALVKTFSGLHEQRLTLLSCTTAVTGNRATASCYGTRRYRPRVGDSTTRIQQGRWRFGLQRSAGTWLIASVDAP